MKMLKISCASCLKYHFMELAEDSCHNCVAYSCAWQWCHCHPQADFFHRDHVDDKLLRSLLGLGQPVMRGVEVLRVAQPTTHVGGNVPFESVILAAPCTYVWDTTQRAGRQKKDLLTSTYDIHQQLERKSYLFSPSSGRIHITYTSKPLYLR